MEYEIRIQGRKISPKSSTFIIAEIGVNHNGDISTAKKLIDAAVEAGTDAVKFQTFKAKRVVSKEAPKAKYQRETTGENESQYEMLKKFELTKQEHIGLIEHCKNKGIIFMSTPHDQESIDLLDELGLPVFKVGSGDLTNIPFLRKVASKDKPVILSTGMSMLEEVREAVKAIYSTSNKKLILLHCTSNYPTKVEDVNLNAIETLRKKFKVPVGYSDHTEGIEVSIAAVAKGASVIEKHLTLSKRMKGPDHKASLEPKEFSNMVNGIRIIEKALGDGVKRPTESEMEIKQIARKSIVAACDISKGTKLTSKMLAIKRPGTGIPPKYLTELEGKKVLQSIKQDEVLTWAKVLI